MPNPENIKGKGNRFSSTNQPANRGRKPKLYTLAKAVYKIGYEEFREVALHLMQMTKKELAEVVNDDDTPVWVINIAKALHKDTGKGEIRVLRELFDRVFGKVGGMNPTDSDSKSGQEELKPRSEFLSYSPDPTMLPPLPQKEGGPDE